MDDVSAIEAQYRRSTFIQDICVFPHAGTDGLSSLRALVVPNLERLRSRRIVNVGDLLRFEMEGLAIGLPAESRVVAYDISFEPLPRTSSGAIDREEVQRRALERSAAIHRNDGAPRSQADWASNPHAATVVEALCRRSRTAHAVAPEANLEIDLGIDSLERVELLVELEHRCGVKIPPDAAHQIYTVHHLVEALRPGAREPRGEPTERAWTMLLRALPAPTDPVLGRLLERKRLLGPLMFAAYRVWRCLVHLEVSGLAHVTRDDVFIIAPNHQSYLDSFFVSCVLPYRTFRRLFLLGATEYFETPLMRWLARALNIVPVDPDANLIAAMQAGAFGLSHGKVLMIFPEGERSIDGRVKRFKKGAPILSAHLGVPIVPVAINGSFEVWPRNRPIGWRRLGFWNRHRVRIQFGAPIHMDPAASYADGAQRLQDAVEALW